MKRDNLIMPTYIGVIALSIIVKLFWAYPMWEALVVGVTCSSACFAIADYASSYAIDLKNIAGLVVDSSKDIFELCTYFQAEFANKIVEINEENFEETDTKKRYSNFLSLCRDFALDMAKSSKTRQNDATTNRKKIRCFECFSVGFNVAGLFLFFSFLIFPDILKVLTGKLDWISVFSFVIMLLTQYLSARRKEKYYKELKRNEQFYDSMEKFFLCIDEGGYRHAD